MLDSEITSIDKSVGFLQVGLRCFGGLEPFNKFDVCLAVERSQQLLGVKELTELLGNFLIVYQFAVYYLFAKLAYSIFDLPLKLHKLFIVLFGFLMSFFVRVFKVFSESFVIGCFDELFMNHVFNFCYLPLVCFLTKSLVELSNALPHLLVFFSQ